MTILSNGHLWKYSDFIENKNFSFDKNKILNSLSKKDIDHVDLGTKSEASVDYPKFAKTLCKNINKSSMGILICGSGIGVSISANRHKHIRASLCHNAQTAKMTRKHNDSNVICLKGRPFVKKNIFAMLNAYFKTEFDKGRHLRRISQI